MPPLRAADGQLHRSSGNSSNTIGAPAVLGALPGPEQRWPLNHYAPW